MVNNSNVANSAFNSTAKFGNLFSSTKNKPQLRLKSSNKQDHRYEIKSTPEEDKPIKVIDFSLVIAKELRN